MDLAPWHLAGGGGRVALRALLLLHRRGGLLQGRAHVDRPAPHRAAGGARQPDRAKGRAQRAVGVDTLHFQCTLDVSTIEGSHRALH